MVLDAENAPLVAGYGIIPALCMFAGSMISSFVAVPPPKVVFALQHLAGGIILSAIAIEFVPVLIDDHNASPWEIPAILMNGNIIRAVAYSSMESIPASFEAVLRRATGLRVAMNEGGRWASGLTLAVG
jgi:hypothetical protein